MERLHRSSDQFWRFALPSMLAQLLNSLFIIVDGFFIGQNMGDAGLAAINVAWPMVALIQAISMAIGTGAAVRLAIDVGRGDLESAQKARGHAIFMLAAVTLLLGLGFYLNYPWILPLLGANEELYPLTVEYIRVVCIFSGCQIFTTGLLPLLRGSGRNIAAMLLTVLGLLCNIWLDWLFIHRCHWGMAGAALATALAQGACALPCVFLLMKHKKFSAGTQKFRLEPKRMVGILYYGISTFGLSISSSILILFGNLQALRYGGTQGVAVYAVLSYILGSVIPLVSGVGDGIQPLLGNAYGAMDWDSIAKLRRKGLALAVGTSLACSVICWIFREQLPTLFGASEEGIAECAGAMWTLVVAFPFMAAVRFWCSYFCALGIPTASSALAYGEPLIVQPIFLFMLPLFMDLQGVWVSYPVAVVVMAGIAWWLLLTHRRKHPH